MRANQFEQPVFMERRFFIEEVGCLEDVFDALEEWPENERDVAHEAMLRACHKAETGTFPISAVRENFERFLKRQGKLVQTQLDDHSACKRTA